MNTVARAASAIALIVLLAACSKQQESLPAAAPAIEAADSNAARAPKAAVTSASTEQQLGSSAATYTDSERKFIRTADVRFRVNDVYVAALAIEDIVASHGGFVVKNDIAAESVGKQSHAIGDGKLLELNEYVVKGHLIVRVPSPRTQEFLRAIAGHVQFLDQRNFAARDAQFALLRQQLEMQRNQETQGELAQAVQDGGKLAQKTDAIKAGNEAKGARDAALLAKKEFEDQVAFSTIELHLYQQSAVAQSERVDVSSVYRQARPGFFSRLGEQLRGGWLGFEEFMLDLAGIWPFLLIASALSIGIWRYRRRRRAAQV